MRRTNLGAVWWVRLIVAAAAASLPAACTLLNTFETLKQAPADSSVPVESGGGGDSSGPDVVMSDADAGKMEGAAESSVDAPTQDVQEAGPAPDAGVIVVGGTQQNDGGSEAGTTPILTALNPQDGTELPKAREMLNVAAVQYDGLREYWYVFESGGVGYFPTPTDPVYLHVRTLDITTGAWTTVQSLKIPPIVSFTLATVLVNRIAYIAYDVSAEGSIGEQLVEIDTGTPTNPTVAYTLPLPEDPIGLIGTRSGTGSGGVVNLLFAGSCTQGNCLTLQHVTLPPNDPPALGTSSALGPYFGSPAFGSYLSGGPEDVIGWSVALPSVTINTYTPQNLLPNGTPIQFSSNDGVFKPFAFAECLHQALLIGTNQDLAVYAIPLASATGVPARGTITHSGQGVYFEPFSSTVLAPFSQGDGYELTAFTLGGSSSMPTLTPRLGGWSPPGDLRPEMIAVRQPQPIDVCP